VTRRQLDDVLTSDLWARPRTYVLLGAYAGLRVHEIAKVRGEDVDTDAMTLRVHGKGGVEAVLPLHPLIATISRGYPDRGWWFPSPARASGGTCGLRRPDCGIPRRPRPRYTPSSRMRRCATRSTGFGEMSTRKYPRRPGRSAGALASCLSWLAFLHRPSRSPGRWLA
jgi:integrase